MLVQRFSVGFMASIVVFSCSVQMTAADTPTSLVGTWRLVSYEDRSDGTTEYPYGTNPAGLLIYDATGHMAIQIMKTPPPRVASGDEYKVAVQEKAALLDGYVAYFGTYTVDWVKRVVTVVAQGDLYSVYIGREEQRPFDLNGDRLTLTPQWKQDGKLIHGIRVFERVK
jgi:hypothetical protein